ncbi:MAG: hypothetical protein IPO64_12895 [Bacteroidetes bacterium]|nr:hypothetical protein [Bacteroidota bacterium]
MKKIDFENKAVVIVDDVVTWQDIVLCIAIISSKLPKSIQIAILVMNAQTISDKSRFCWVSTCYHYSRTCNCTI